MIDSAEKRRAAGGVPFLPLGPGVTPNASKDAEWRAQAGWSYSGFLEAAEGGDIASVMRIMRRRRDK